MIDASNTEPTASCADSRRFMGSCNIFGKRLRLCPDIVPAYQLPPGVDSLSLPLVHGGLSGNCRHACSCERTKLQHDSIELDKQATNRFNANLLESTRTHWAWNLVRDQGV